MHVSSFDLIVYDLGILLKDVIACSDVMKAFLSVLSVFISCGFIVYNGSRNICKAKKMSNKVEKKPTKWKKTLQAIHLIGD